MSPGNPKRDLPGNLAARVDAGRGANAPPAVVNHAGKTPRVGPLPRAGPLLRVELRQRAGLPPIAAGRHAAAMGAAGASSMNAPNVRRSIAARPR